MPVSLDLFGTLVAVDGPTDPAMAVADELAARDVPVPDDWESAYRTSYASVPEGAAYPLDEHVRDALAAHGIEAESAVVADAVAGAFSPDTVTTREGAGELLRQAAAAGPTGVLSNCSVRGLVEACLERSTLDCSLLDAVVVSVDCGWRKPDARAFEAVADALGCPPSALVHVGDDPGPTAASPPSAGRFPRRRAGRRAR